MATNWEVRRAVFSMAALKSPRVDDFHPLFNRKHWGEVGRDVVKFVNGVLEFCTIPTGLNNTIISLIPK